jgi:hypothetical protein
VPTSSYRGPSQSALRRGLIAGSFTGEVTTALLSSLGTSRASGTHAVSSGTVSSRNQQYGEEMTRVRDAERFDRLVRIEPMGAGAASSRSRVDIGGMARARRRLTVITLTNRVGTRPAPAVAAPHLTPTRCRRSYTFLQSHRR